jgi:DnaJ-domain-containing protein 1
MIDPSTQTDAMQEQEPTPCSGCDSQRMSPLACGSCGLLDDNKTLPSPFQLFGFAPTWTTCPMELRKRLMRITRLTHPDLHGAAGDPEQIRLAEHHTARLNIAYRVLTDDVERTEWLITYLQGPPASKGVPQALLMEVMDWNEVLDDVQQGDADAGALTELSQELQSRRHHVMSDLREVLDPLPEPGSPKLQTAREHLDVLRYLARILERTKALQSA